MEPPCFKEPVLLVEPDTSLVAGGNVGEDGGVVPVLCFLLKMTEHCGPDSTAGHVGSDKIGDLGPMCKRRKCGMGAEHPESCQCSFPSPGGNCRVPMGCLHHPVKEFIRDRFLRKGPKTGPDVLIEDIDNLDLVGFSQWNEEEIRHPEHVILQYR